MKEYITNMSFVNPQLIKEVHSDEYTSEYNNLLKQALTTYQNKLE